ncbi:AraC family transcriptional regulator [Clostridium vincentii]|uniref:Melibiose operon regulatory protein n=1 Tax=Clostridium vincentii TaxID=52704 RepID=A0A2T0BFP2_9CLOT|nr:AraC family transcriptional regulator [Clostridium vincentii]PRR82726.1 Melibiose operon regulatory protein [Clostridium vincentii]
MNIINLKENKIHGDFILPFTTYFSEFTNNSSSFVAHWHEEIEITFIEKGSGEFKVDLDSYIFKKGDILIIPPFALHTMYPTDSTYCSLSTIVFNLGMLNSLITDGCSIKYFAPILNNEHQFSLIKEDSKGYNEMLNSLKEIFNCFDSKSDIFELKLKSLLFYFFSLIYENDLVLKKTVAPLTNESIKRIKIILNYIHENYMNTLLIRDIAKACNLSQYYFMKFFKKHIGMTCTEYITVYRLDLSSKLLSSTDKSITEISFETGFNNVSYFNKLFKEKFKVTPKEFSRANKV